MRRSSTRFVRGSGEEAWRVSSHMIKNVLWHGSCLSWRADPQDRRTIRLFGGRPEHHLGSCCVLSRGAHLLRKRVHFEIDFSSNFLTIRLGWCGGYAARWQAGKRRETNEGMKSRRSG